VHDGTAVGPAPTPGFRTARRPAPCAPSGASQRPIWATGPCAVPSPTSSASPTNDRVRQCLSVGSRRLESRHGQENAASVMVAVFAIFATLSPLDFKQLGVGSPPRSSSTPPSSALSCSPPPWHCSANATGGCPAGSTSSPPSGTDTIPGPARRTPPPVRPQGCHRSQRPRRDRTRPLRSPHGASEPHRHGDFRTFPPQQIRPSRDAQQRVE
jgi:hypothetical protein